MNFDECLSRINEINGEVRGRFSPGQYAIGLTHEPEEVDLSKWINNDSINISNIIKDLDFIHEMTHYIQYTSCTFGLESAISLAKCVHVFSKSEAHKISNSNDYVSKRYIYQFFVIAYMHYQDEIRIHRDKIIPVSDISEHSDEVNDIICFPSNPLLKFDHNTPCIDQLKIFKRTGKHLFPIYYVKDNLCLTRGQNGDNFIRFNTACLMEAYAAITEYLYLISLFEHKGETSRASAMSSFFEKFESLPPQYSISVAILAEYLSRPLPAELFFRIHNVAVDISLMYSTFLIERFTEKKYRTRKGYAATPVCIFMDVVKEVSNLEITTFIGSEGLDVDGIQDALCDRLGIPTTSELVDLAIRYVEEQKLAVDEDISIKNNRPGRIYLDLYIHLHKLGLKRRKELSKGFCVFSFDHHLINEIYKIERRFITSFDIKSREIWGDFNVAHMNFSAFAFSIENIIKGTVYSDCPLKFGYPYYCPASKTVDQSGVTDMRCTMTDKEGVSNNPCPSQFINNEMVDISFWNF